MGILQSRLSCKGATDTYRACMAVLRAGFRCNREPGGRHESTVTGSTSGLPRTSLTYAGKPSGRQVVFIAQ
jgi:hypothetical protein